MKRLFISFLTTLSLVSCFHMKNRASKTEQAPVAKEVVTHLEKHGDTRLDPYFWMRERDTKPVLDYINAENNYADKILKPSKNIADSLFKEMKSRIKEDDSTPPYKMGNYYYYVRYEKGKEYPLYCRKLSSLKATEEIILDINVLAKGKSYYSAYLIEPSPDHKIIAFAVDEVGRRFYTIYFKDLTTNQILEKNIPKTTGNWVWFNDNKTGYYTQQDPETLRSDRVFKTSLNSKTSELVSQEKDALFNMGVSKSLNDQTIFIQTGSFDSSEVWYIAADAPNAKPQLFLKRQKKHLYSVDDGGDVFFIRNNKNAENFQIFTTPKDKIAQKNWKPFVEHRKNFLAEDMLVLKDYVIVEGREAAATQIEIYARKGKKKKRISFKEDAYVAGLTSNADYAADTIRYSYSSLVTPPTVFDFSIEKENSKVIKETEVPTYQAKLYETKRVWAKSKDGKKIPISLVYKKKLFKEGENPLFQYGYGSYGISMDPNFRISVVSLLDRGFVFAIAHIRGGQELGRHWYEDGRMAKKKNTFDDFITVTESLLKDGYGKKGHVYIEGGSAGGLLMGAVINLRPDLYHAAHAAVPFVDVLTTMLDESIPLTVAEYEQWGNPNKKAEYNYIKSYSPYDNIKPLNYPHLLITTGYHDSQVQYWEPLKWLAKLRKYNTSTNHILMRTEMKAGHSGVTGRFSRIRQIADEYAFFVWLESRQPSS
ncbi:MAG: S9 family peptidase [Bdellovibrionaceae bacterium]|nr:S9 family peptidase [Pseudobdellovibrionaceae bacterium]